MKEIKTTGELRTYLCQTMTRLDAGEIKSEDAARICKLASQVNESFYSEIKVKKTMMEAGEKKTAELGQLKIG
jgi:hypothetical protein